MLKITNKDADYFRRSDGGNIDTLAEGTVVDATGWTQNGKEYVNLGNWDGSTFTPSGKTGWFYIGDLDIFIQDDPNPPPPPPVLENIRVELGIYLGADETTLRLGQLVQDDRLVIIETTDHWFRVERLSDGLTGWVMTTYLIPVTDNPPPPPQTGEKMLQYDEFGALVQTWIPE